MSSEADKTIKAVYHFEGFINDKLKEDLSLFDTQQKRIVKEMEEFLNIKKSLELIKRSQFPGGYRTQVNLGCNFYMQAKVQDTSTMLFHIGLDHFLEFTQEQAIKYVNARINALERASTELKEKTAQTKAHIKLMLIGIGELQGINSNSLS